MRDEALGQPFGIELSREGEALVVALSGALAAECEERFNESLRRCDELDPSIVVIDLRRLTFIDSAGLKMILTASARLRDEGRRVAVVRGKAQVQRLFELTGAERALTVVDHPSEALAG